MNRQIVIYLEDMAGWKKQFTCSRDLLSFFENEIAYWEKKEKFSRLAGSDNIAM